ncbi:nuclear migration protein Jnm1p [[Candida] jaroonii]|uniref:Nuclear migration protein Jnm1p n=1 Tax=[Candida] jaroonii TaxID=467808 RepID=A0ACA9YG48_9ASCO|nr:nuclear migration protein Jnm1p [[Candida] jaroonii]
MDIESGVYETSDIESEPDIHVPTASDNPDIIEEEINTGEAFKRFDNQFVQGKINFNYSVDRSLSDSGFKTQFKETKQNKLNRILRELHELDTEDEDEEVDKLIKLAEDLKLKKKNDLSGFKERIMKIFEGLETISHENIEAEKLTDIDEVLELDKKISKLEGKLGDINATKSIDQMLNELNRKVDIIHNPEYKIDQVNESIKEILEKTEFINNYNEVNEGSLELFKNDKINELLTFLPNLQSFEKSSGLLIQRLKYLSEIHLKIGSSVEFIDNLDQSLNNMDNEINQWNESLNNINNKLDSYQEMFEKNKKDIDNWINQLKESRD